MSDWNSYYLEKKEIVPWGIGFTDPCVVDFVEHYDFSRESTCLDAGCGHGKNTGYLINRGFNVIAADISEYAVNYAERNLKHAQFRVADVAELNTIVPERSLDFLVDVGCFHVVLPQYRERVIGQYYDSIADDGKLLLRVFCDDTMDKPMLMMPGHDLPVYGFNEFDIYSLFTGKFNIDKMLQKKHCFAQLPVWEVYMSKKIPPVKLKAQ